MATLWHHYSKVLNGFYASSIYACASNRVEAIALTIQAFDAWAAEQVSEYLFNPLTSSFPDDPDYPAEAAAVRTKFIEEVNKGIYQIPENVTLIRKI